MKKVKKLKYFQLGTTVFRSVVDPFQTNIFNSSALTKLNLWGCNLRPDSSPFDKSPTNFGLWLKKFFPYLWLRILCHARTYTLHKWKSIVLKTFLRAAFETYFIFPTSSSIFSKVEKCLIYCANKFSIFENCGWFLSVHNYFWDDFMS